MYDTLSLRYSLVIIMQNCAQNERISDVLNSFEIWAILTLKLAFTLCHSGWYQIYDIFASQFTSINHNGDPHTIFYKFPYLSLKLDQVISLQNYLPCLLLVIAILFILTSYASRIRNPSVRVVKDRMFYLCMVLH